MSESVGENPPILLPVLERDEAWVADAIAKIENAKEANRRDLAASGFEWPTSIESWMHLARVVGIPFETIRSGDFTAADVRDWAVAFADREEHLAKLHRRSPTHLATQEDRDLLRSLVQWREIAREEVESIGGWRDADSSDLYHRYWCSEPRPIKPQWLHLHTAKIQHAAIRLSPDLNPETLTTVWRAIESWYRESGPHKLPPQSELEDQLERSLLLIEILQSELHRRAVEVMHGEQPTTAADHLGAAGEGLGAIASDTQTRATPSDLRTAAWFARATDNGLYPDLLRTAKNRGALNGELIGRRWHYSISEVVKKYPEREPKIAAAAERERTEANGNEQSPS